MRVRCSIRIILGAKILLVGVFLAMLLLEFCLVRYWLMYPWTNLRDDEYKSKLYWGLVRADLDK